MYVHVHVLIRCILGVVNVLIYVKKIKKSKLRWLRTYLEEKLARREGYLLCIKEVKGWRKKQKKAVKIIISGVIVVLLVLLFLLWCEVRKEKEKKKKRKG